jgi:signal transduction histidine kinase
VSLVPEKGRVDDNGPGIAPGEREKVFALFYRLERLLSRETGGVSLGLSVARTVAREHGGDITLMDVEGAGLRVRMQLPSLQGVSQGPVPAGKGPVPPRFERASAIPRHERAAIDFH